MEEKYIEYLRSIYQTFGGKENFGKFQDFVTSMSDTTDLGSAKRREVYDKFGGQEVFGQFDNFQRVTTGGAISQAVTQPELGSPSVAPITSAEATDLKKKSFPYDSGESVSPSLTQEFDAELKPDPVGFFTEMSQSMTAANIFRDVIIQKNQQREEEIQKEKDLAASQQYRLSPEVTAYRGTLADFESVTGVDREFEMVDGLVLPVLTDKEKQVYVSPSSGFLGFFEETEKEARDRAIITAAGVASNTLSKSIKEAIAGLPIAEVIQSTSLMGPLAGGTSIPRPGELNLKNQITTGIVDFQKGLLWQNQRNGFGLDIERYMELEATSRTFAPNTTDKDGNLTAWGEFSIASTMANPGQVSYHMIKAFAKDPIGTTTQLIIPSLATFLPTMFAAAVEDPMSVIGPRAVAGLVSSKILAAGGENAAQIANIVNKAGRSSSTAYLSGVSSYSISMAAEMNQQAQEAGYDLTNEEDVKAMLENTELRQQWYETARKYAVPVAVVDAFSGALAGNVFNKGGRLSLLKETGVQAGLGGVSEVAGILGKEGEIKASDIPDIFAEMFGEVGPGAVEVALNNNLNTGTVYNERRQAIDQEILAIQAGITEDSTPAQKEQAKEAITELVDLKNKEYAKDIDFLNSLSETERTNLNKINDRISFLKETVAELEAQKEGATTEKIAELDKQIEINNTVIKQKQSERGSIVSKAVVKKAVEQAVGTVGIRGEIKAEDVADFTTVENKNLSTTKAEDVVERDLNWVQRIIPKVKAARVLRDLNSFASLTGSNVSFAPTSEAFEKSFGTDVNAVWDPKTNTIYVNIEKSKGNFYFHEMSHPLVRKMRVENPDLFNSLYANVQGIAQRVSNKQTYGKWANLEYQDFDADSRKEEAIVEFFADVFDGKFDSATRQITRSVVEFIADFFTAIGAEEFGNNLINEFEGRRGSQMTLSEFMKRLQTNKDLESVVIQNIRKTFSNVTTTTEQQVPGSEQTRQAAEQAPDQETGAEKTATSGDVQATKEKVAPTKPARRATRAKKLDTEEAPAPAKPKADKKGRPAKKKPADKKIADDKRLPKNEWAQKMYDEAHAAGNKRTMMNMKRYAYNQGFELKLKKGDTAYDPSTDTKAKKKAAATAAKGKSTAKKIAAKKDTAKEEEAAPFVDKTGTAGKAAQEAALAEMNKLHEELSALQEKYRRQTSRKYKNAAAKTLKEIAALEERIKSLVPETQAVVSKYESETITKSQLPTEQESAKRGKAAKNAIKEQEKQAEIDQKVDEEVGIMSIKDYMGLEALDGGVVYETRIVYNEDGSIYAIYDFRNLTIKRPTGKGKNYKQTKIGSLREFSKKYRNALKEKVPMANTVEAERLSLADAAYQLLSRNIQKLYAEGKDDVAALLEETSLPRAKKEYEDALDRYRIRKQELIDSGQKTMRGVESNLIARRRPVIVLLNKIGKPVVSINANTLEIGRRKRASSNYEYQQYASSSAFTKAINQLQKDIDAGTLRIQASQEIDYQRKQALASGLISQEEYDRLVREANALTERTKVREQRRTATEILNQSIKSASAKIRKALPSIPESIVESLSVRLMSVPLSGHPEQARQEIVNFLLSDIETLMSTQRGKTTLSELYDTMLTRFNAALTIYEERKQAQEFAKLNAGLFDKKLPNVNTDVQEAMLRELFLEGKSLLIRRKLYLRRKIGKSKSVLTDITFKQAMQSDKAMARFLGSLGYSQEESSRVKRVAIDTSLRNEINELPAATPEEKIAAIKQMLEKTEIVSPEMIYNTLSGVLERTSPLPTTPNMIALQEQMRKNKMEQMDSLKRLMFSRKSNSRNNETAQALKKVLNVTGSPVSITNLHAIQTTGFYEPNGDLANRFAQIYSSSGILENSALRDYIQMQINESQDPTLLSELNSFALEDYNNGIEIYQNMVVAALDALISSDLNSESQVDVYDDKIKSKYFVETAKNTLKVNAETSKRIEDMLSSILGEMYGKDNLTNADELLTDALALVSMNMEKYEFVHADALAPAEYTPAPGVERAYEIQRRYFARPANNKYFSIKDRNVAASLIEQKIARFNSLAEILISERKRFPSRPGAIYDIFASLGTKKWSSIIEDANPVGMTVNDMTQLAEAFGHIRSKIRETSAFAIIDNDKIVDVVYLTNFNTSTSAGINSRIADLLDNEYPNAIVAMLHNHPSGVAVPSNEDLEVSLLAESRFGKRFGGSIILNGKTYGFMAPIGRAKASIANDYIKNLDSLDKGAYLENIYSEKIGLAKYKPKYSRPSGISVFDKQESIPSIFNQIASSIKENRGAGFYYGISVPSSRGSVIVDFGFIEPETATTAGVLAKLQMAKRGYGSNSQIHIAAVSENQTAEFKAKQQEILDSISAEIGAGVVNSYTLISDSEIQNEDYNIIRDVIDYNVDYQIPSVSESALNNYGAPIVTEETFTVGYGDNVYSLPELFDNVFVPALKEEVESYIADINNDNMLDEIGDLIMFPFTSDILSEIDHITAGVDLSTEDGARQLIESYLLEVVKQSNISVAGRPELKKLLDISAGNIIEEIVSDSSSSFDPSALMFSRKGGAYRRTEAAKKLSQNRRNIEEIQKRNKSVRARVRETALDKKFEVFRFINDVLNDENAQKAKVLEAFIRTSAGLGKSIEIKIKEAAKYVFGSNPNMMSTETMDIIGEVIIYKTILEHNRRRLDKLQSQYSTKKQALGDYESLQQMEEELEVAKQQFRDAQKRENSLMAELTSEGISSERIIEIENELSVIRELLDESLVLVEDLPYRIGVVKGTTASIKTLQNPLINPEGLTVDEIQDALAALEQDYPESFADFDEAANRFFDIARELAEEKEAAGLITEAQKEALVRYGYSPRIFVQRLMDAEMLNVSLRGQSARSGVVSLAGGSSAAMITNPMSLLRAMMVSHENAVGRNDVGVKLYELVQDSPGNGIVEIIEPTIVKGQRTFPAMTQDAGFTVIEVLIDGEKHRMKVPISFYNSWRGLQSFNTHAAIKIISGSYFTKLGATILNPAFSFVNLMADFLMVTTFTNSFGKTMPVAMARGVRYIVPALAKAMASNNPIYQVQSKSIREAYDYGIAMDYIRNEAIDLSKNLNAPEGKTQATRMMKSGIDWIYNAMTFMQENFEMATRLAIYNYQKEVIAKNNPNLSNEDIGRLASLKAREHLDYSVGGTHASLAESFVPYTNAALRALETSIYAMSPKAGSSIFGNRVKLKDDMSLDNRVVDASVAANIAMFAAGYAAVMMFNNAIGMRDDDEDDHDLKHINDEVKNRNIVLLTGKRNAQGEPHYIKIRIPYEMTPFVRLSQIMLDGTMFTDHHKNNASDAVRLAYENIPLIGQGLASKNAESLLMNLFGQVPTVSSLLAYYGNYDTFYDQSVWHSETSDVNPGIEIDYNTRPTFIKWGMEAGMSPKRTQVAFEKVFTGTRTNYWSNILFNKLDKTNYEELIKSGVIIKEQVKSPDEISKNAITGRITDNYGNIDWQMAGVYENLEKAKDYKTQRVAENNQIRALVKSQAKNNELGTSEGYQRLYDVVVQIAPSDVERQNELIKNYTDYAMTKGGLPRRSSVYASITDVTKRADALLSLKVEDPDVFNEVIEDLFLYQQITGKSLITETMVERFREFEEGD